MECCNHVSVTISKKVNEAFGSEKYDFPRENFMIDCIEKEA